MDERREHVRIPLVSIARLTPQGLDSKRLVSIRDISTHGVGIYNCEEEYQKGEIVVIELHLTDADEALSDSISGEVVWVTPIHDGTRRSVGIRFDHMEQEKPKLYAFIKRLEEKVEGGSPDLSKKNRITNSEGS
ncbi:MAG: PilZ domain-containing protein [Nitrospirae bacterium]|nr:PilZ domain-containing protein [Candidatus Manganitrophaceae bacterium]